MRPDQQLTLAKPFEFDEHGFKKEIIYIRKSAIRRRLSEVDPQWKLSPPEFVCVDGDVVIMRGSLTVCGITRHQIGSGIIQRKDTSGKLLEGYILASMVAKAYKEAATNILARAAIEFNVGSYLKDVSVEDKPTSPERLKTLLRKLGHWSSGGGRERASEMLRVLGLDWATAAKEIEPGRTLTAISETTLAEAEFMKRLVELSTRLADKPAQAQFSPQKPLQKIYCPTNLLEEGDVVHQSHKPVNGGEVVTRYQVLKNFGRLGSSFKVTVKNLATQQTESMEWSGGDMLLVDGPKVRAYAENPTLCVKKLSSSTPLWNAQFAPMGS